MNRIILVTGVSASGKTSLQDELITRGWKRPINFTTRTPRSDDVHAVDGDGDYNSNEADEYVFLTKDAFITKLKNGDFLEMTMPNGTFYGISKYIPDGNVCMVVDPVGRAQIQEYFISLGYDIETYYLECSEQLQLERLNNRGDTPKGILYKKKDFKWFSPTNKCIKLSGKRHPSELADFIEKRWNEGKV